MIALACLAELAKVRTSWPWLSAMGTMPNATNGFSLGLNWTAGKLPAVNGSNGSTVEFHNCRKSTIKVERRVWRELWTRIAAVADIGLFEMLAQYPTFTAQSS